MKKGKKNDWSKIKKMAGRKKPEAVNIKRRPVGDGKTSLFELFCVFFKISLFTFGGGAAMLPLLERELVEKRNYVTEKDILDYYAIGQCTPGIIAINTATFVGYKLRGVAGAFWATAGIIAPSFFIILFIAGAAGSFFEDKTVQHAMNGIRVMVVVLIFQACFQMYRGALAFKIQKWFFFICAAFLFLFSGNPLFYLVAGCSAGLFFLAFEKKFHKKRKSNKAGSDNPSLLKGMSEGKKRIPFLRKGAKKMVDEEGKNSKKAPDGT